MPPEASNTNAVKMTFLFVQRDLEDKKCNQMPPEAKTQVERPFFSCSMT